MFCEIIIQNNLQITNNLFIRMLLRALLLVTGVAALRYTPYDRKRLVNHGVAQQFLI